MTSASKDDKVVYPRLSYALVGACYTVHNTLARFVREKQYADKLEQVLQEEGIRYEREKTINNSGNVVDFLIEDCVILELKAVRTIGRTEFRQVQNYLQQSGLKLGIIVNFNEKHLRPRRVLRIDSWLFVDLY